MSETRPRYRDLDPVERAIRREEWAGMAAAALIVFVIVGGIATGCAGGA